MPLTNLGNSFGAVLSCSQTYELLRQAIPSADIQHQRPCCGFKMLLSVADVAAAAASAEAEKIVEVRAEANACGCLLEAATPLMVSLAFASAAAVSACTARPGKTAASFREACECLAEATLTRLCAAVQQLCFAQFHQPINR